MQFWHLIILAFSFTQTAEAGIDGLIEYASQGGSMSNYNGPAIVKDQQGGYLSGGSLIIRGPRPKELTPLSIQTPKLKYDACTGSGDFRFGSMSYISGAEFSSFLKNVARASGAYLVKMSIKTACPQCEDIMTYLETVARDINNMTLNQCSMAQSIAQGAFNKLVSSDRQQCMMNSNFQGSNRDMFETTKNCQAKAGENDSLYSEELKDNLRGNFNLVWKLLGSGSTDGNFKELMMSVSGTLIVKKEDGRYKFQYLPSLIIDKDFLEKYIGNGAGDSKIEIYSCDNMDKCLSPSLVKKSLKRDQTIYGNISRLLISISNKVKRDNADFTDEESALLSFSTIPLLSLIEMEVASKTDNHDMLIRIDEFIDAVCLDIITNYLQIIISRIMSGLKNMEYVQIDNSIINNFVDDCDKVRKFLRDSKFNAFQKLQLVMQVKERIKLQRKEFEYRFARFLSDVKGK